jgi:predicted MPP superfamily phosphohydrolase
MRTVLATILTAALSLGTAAQPIQLPGAPNSLKFAAIGDMGTGARPQYEVGEQMAQAYARQPFELVVMLGDNLYGAQNANDYVNKFERPYAALLKAGVTFQAVLGNHDAPKAALAYKHFNMNGRRYYSFTRRNVRFVVIDSNQLDPAQLAWIEETLKSGPETWTIAMFHHPLYSNAGRHGSNAELRVELEPLLVKYGVDVVLSGHDHAYERLKPQKGITYFLEGASGQLRKGDIQPSPDTAAFFDQDQSFMVAEIVGDTMTFQTISRTGRIVDAGTIRRR